MTSEAITEQHLPTSPASVGEDYQQRFHQPIQHNAATPYTSDHHSPESDPHALSNHGSHYASPAATTWPMSQHTPDGQYQQEDEHHGYNHDLYGSPLQAQNTPHPYHYSLPREAHYPNQLFGASSPPAPSDSDVGHGYRRPTRSGRPLASNGPSRRRGATDDRSRTSGSPKAKKAKHTKGDRSKVPKIDAPLSELTRDYKHIPVRNMDEWVNRPVEVRKKEVEKRNGYITRPMNSFMLYRSAYAERTKIWCLQNNHQIVSSVSGESWPMEPPEVREQYNEYARIERDNHQKAHPGYKFSPSKAANSARKRKGTTDESDEEVTNDHDDPDQDWRPPGEKKERMKSNKRLGREAGYPVNSGLHGDADFGLPPLEPGMHKSSYHASNPGKPLPASLDDLNLYGQYYETTIIPSGPRIEDVRMVRTPMPGTHYGSGPPTIGLPGSHHYELLGHDSLDNFSTMSESQVDPILLGYQDQPNGAFTEQSFHDFNEGLMFDSAPQPYSQYGGGDQYQNDPYWAQGETGLIDTDEEFTRLMEDHNNR